MSISRASQNWPDGTTYNLGCDAPSVEDVRRLLGVEPPKGNFWYKLLRAVICLASMTGTIWFLLWAGLEGWRYVGR